ncbi:MAG TPA: BTAD domain-containing putative transcriptional regulator, partial [Anaerolineae bacterium]
MEEHFLSLHLLGEMRIARNGKSLRFRSQTEAALLIYLAHTGQTHSREAIADLLWEARTTQQSLSNLRTVLARLRRLADDVLVITHKTLAYKAAARQQVDSVRLSERLEALRDVDSDADAARLREALRLYKGDFLAGFHLPNAPRFNDWVVVAQERLRQTLFAGYQRLLEYALAQGDFELGIETATRWLAWDELNETTHQQLIRLLAQSGRTAAAITQYEQCVAVLAAELGVAPHKATTALYERVRQGAFEAAAEARVVHRRVDHNLPRDLTPFFGRDAEIEEVTRRVLDSTYPLVTLTGEGGIGKTRLALATARRLLEAEHPFGDGVWFVSLAEVLSPGERHNPGVVREAVATAVGSAMGMVFHGQRTPSQQWLAFLREKNTLLILDNFEPLLDSGAVNLLLELLQEAPQVNLLVTSRVALDLNSEWVVRLDGLPAPEGVSPDAGAPVNGGVLQPDAESYDSVRLFAERAARTATDFRLAEQLVDVADICRLVAGLPLAIELAAASARRLSCAEIAAALRENMNLLATKRRDVPARQRSMRAVFEYSWQLLDEAEQRVLAQLSVFRGGFSQEAACAVILEPAWRLNGLERHSLLKQDEQGRYRLHALLSEYAGEKLAQLAAAPGREPTNAAQRHSAYYLEAVGQLA